MAAVVIVAAAKAAAALVEETEGHRMVSPFRICVG